MRRDCSVPNDANYKDDDDHHHDPDPAFKSLEGLA